MIRYLRVPLINFSVLLAGASIACARPHWHYEVDRLGDEPDNEGRRAFLEQEFTVLGAACSTRLEFSVTQDQGPGITGLLNLEFTVSPAQSIDGFDFEYFDGPDAPAREERLMKITVTQGSDHFVHTLYQNGYWSAEVTDGFAFQSADLTRDAQSEVRALLEQLREGAQSLEIAITDGRNHSLVLSATFPLSGSRSVFEALLEGI